ncbi:hypothetical protein ALC56_08660 [Trachymyrmex septentrionalis]|uniref:Uncharacterized protein n=1 Tax=Trachymyrmex septentrionalis TaxID=34720 RepID=A0A195F9Z2_9HYME|nr:hypothetical protein ALC56_08660 [Trachymyrmex septentrionalis]
MGDARGGEAVQSVAMATYRHWTPFTPHFTYVPSPCTSFCARRDEWGRIFGDWVPATRLGPGRLFTSANRGTWVPARDSSDIFPIHPLARRSPPFTVAFLFVNVRSSASRPCSAYFESVQDPWFEFLVATGRTLTQTLRKSAYPIPFLSIIYNLYPEISYQCSNKHTETVSDTSFEQYLTPTISLALVLLTSTSSILPRAFQLEQCNVINIIILFVSGDGTFRTATATYNTRASKLVPDTVERIDQSAANRIPHLTTARGSAGVVGGKAAIRRATVWHALRRNEKKGCSRNTDVSRKRKERLLEWKKNRISRVFELFQDIIFDRSEGSFNSVSCQVHLEIICFLLDQDSSIETGLCTYIRALEKLSNIRPKSCTVAQICCARSIKSEY